MKCSWILQIFVALAFVTADDLSPPACAEPCFAPAVAKSGCQATDYICQCTTGKDAITASVLPCLQTTKCTNADFAQLQVFSVTFCPKILAAASASSSVQPQSTSAGSSSKSPSPSGTSSKSGTSSTSPTGVTSPSPSPSAKNSGSDLSTRSPGFETWAITFFAAACIAGTFR